MASYVTLAEAKAMSDMQSEAHDGAFTLALDAATQAIEHYCGRVFVADATATMREYVGTGAAHVWIDECIAVETVQIKTGGAWDDLLSCVPFAGDVARPIFRAPYAGLLCESGTFPTGKLPTVRVWAQWGYADVVPDVVKMAIIGQATRWLKRSQGSWSDALVSADAGTMLYRQVIDPDIRMMLESGRLIRRAIG